MRTLLCLLAGLSAFAAAALPAQQSPIRLHPGEDRTVSLLIDPARVPPDTPVSVSADPGLRLKFWEDAVPEPNRSGWSRLTGVPVERVGAGFHHVLAKETIRPVDLLDEAGLLALVTGG